MEISSVLGLFAFGSDLRETGYRERRGSVWECEKQEEHEQWHEHVSVLKCAD